ncbi:MAG: hypothetical protein ABW104_14405 [Candidatus Thiodiazotropha sp. 6PLUC2]
MNIERFLATLFCLSILLTGCGGEDSTPLTLPTLGTVPASLVLRPGESEQVEFRWSKESNQSFALRYAQLSEAGFTLSGALPCVDNDPLCELRTVTAPATATNELIGRTGRVRAALLIDDEDQAGSSEPVLERHLQGHLPVTLFDAAPINAPPVVDFEVAPAPHSDTPWSLALDTTGQLWSWGEEYFDYDPTELAENSNKDLNKGPAHMFPSPLPGLDSIEDFGLCSGTLGYALDRDGSVWVFSSPIVTENYNAFDFRQLEQKNQLSNIVSLFCRFNDSPYTWPWAWLANGELWEVHHNRQIVGMERVRIGGLVTHWEDEKYLFGLHQDGTVGFYKAQTHITGGFNEVPFDTLDQDVLSYRLLEEIGGLPPIASIYRGGDFVIALSEEGQIYGFGNSQYGELGYIEQDLNPYSCPIYRDCPVVLNQQIDSVVEVATGKHFVVARKGDGTAWVWGDNSFGQMTGLPGGQTAVPRPVNATNNVIAIRAGGNTAMAVEADDSCGVADYPSVGRMLAWGNNTGGSRGDGTGANWAWPTPVLNLGDDTTCSGTAGHRLIIYKSGTGNGVVESSVPGLRCTGQICWQSLPVGSNVTLTATPKPGSSLLEWRWDCSAQTPDTLINMDNTKHCKVVFERTGSNELNYLQVEVVGVEDGERTSDIGGRVTSQPAGIDCPDSCFSEPHDKLNGETEIRLTAIPDEGYSFSGWFRFNDSQVGIGNCENGIVILSTADEYCIAEFTKDPPTPPTDSQDLMVYVELDDSGVRTPNTGGSVTSSPAGIVCPGDCTQTYEVGALVTLTPNPDPGYRFYAWEGSACFDGAVTIPTADVACRSIFIPDAQQTQQLRIIISNNNGSYVTGVDEAMNEVINCPGTCNADIADNSSVVLTHHTAAGDYFSGWASGGRECGIPTQNNRNESTVIMDGPKTCVISYSPPPVNTNTYRLNLSVVREENGVRTADVGGTVNSAPAGIACPGDCTEDYTSGSLITLTPNADPGYQFYTWEGNGCTNGQVTIPSADISCRAVFIPNIAGPHSLTVIMNNNINGSYVTGVDAGMNQIINCPGTCNANVADSTTVVLTHHTASGDYFAGWPAGGTDCGTPDAVDPNQTSILMDGGKVCVANYSALTTFNINVNVSGAAGIVTSAFAEPIAGSPIACASGLCSGSFTAPDTVLNNLEALPLFLEAAPGAGNSFGGWGAGQCDVESVVLGIPRCQINLRPTGPFTIQVDASFL